MPKKGEIRTADIDLALLIKQQGTGLYIIPGTGCEIKEGTRIEIVEEAETNDGRPVYQIKGVDIKIKCYQYEESQLFIDPPFGSLSK